MSGMYVCDVCDADYPEYEMSKKFRGVCKECVREVEKQIEENSIFEILKRIYKLEKYVTNPDNSIFQHERIYHSEEPEDKL